MSVGSTTYEFLYKDGRIYSETTTAPNFYEVIEYRYYDEYFKDPEHRFKEKICEVRYAPDNGPIGWDSNDSVKHKADMLTRSEAGQVVREFQTELLVNRNPKNDYIRHNYNAKDQLIESSHYIYDTSFWSERQLEDEQYISKRVKYRYAKGKLAQVAYYGSGSHRPYMQIELGYDDMPGYLNCLALEARFLPLELPYRAHNIVSFTVKDARGRVRKDLSYTCTYSYNRYGYPTEFIRKMLNGVEVKGHIVY